MRMMACGIVMLALVPTGIAAQRIGRDRPAVTTPAPSPTPTPTASADPRLDAAAGFGAAFGYAYGEAAAAEGAPPPVRRRGSMAQGAPQWRATGDGGVTTTSTGVGIAPGTATTRSVAGNGVVTTTTSEFAEPAPPERPARRRRVRR